MPFFIKFETFQGGGKGKVFNLLQKQGQRKVQIDNSGSKTSTSASSLEERRKKEMCCSSESATEIRKKKRKLC